MGQTLLPFGTKTGFQAGSTLGPSMAGASEAATGGPDDEDPNELLAQYGPSDGHHPVSSAAVKKDPNYNPDTALSISNAQMERLGINHRVVSNAQTSLYKEFGRSNSTITWQDIARIEQAALERGGASPQMAQNLVNRSIQYLQDSGVTILRIPHGP